MHPAIAFFALMGFLAIGEFISIKTKAIIPSILVFLILLLTFVWNGVLPKDVISIAGFSDQLTEVIMVVIVVNMGCSLSLSELKREWKTVFIGVAAIVGIAAVMIPIGSILFDFETAIVSAPPIAGGFVATFEMSRAAIQKGLTHLSTLALLIMALQEFPAYVLLPSLLKKEGKHRLEAFRAGNSQQLVVSQSKKERKKIFGPLPEKFRTESVYLFLLSAVGVIAIIFSKLSGQIFALFNVKFSISPTVFALILGVISGEIGFTERKSLQKANSFGFFVVASLVGVMGGLVDSSPSEIFSSIGPIAILIILGVIGMGLGGIIVGKLLGNTWQMSFAIALNCLIGFPVNFLLTNEAIKALAETEEEKDYLTNTMIPTMLVGGFTTVTLGSVIFAGIAVNFL